MAATRKADPRPLTNPHAEWISPDELPALVESFYGTRTLMLDKAMAERLLAMNTGNRKINRRKLQQLAHQMANGEFANTGEAIIVSREGVLNDGQHRLQAIVESDAVLDLDVRFGIPREAFSKTDTGSARTPGDVLSIKGVPSGGQVASAVRLLLLYERGLPDSIREFISNDEVGKAFERWKDIEEVHGQVNAHAFPRAIRSTPLYATAFLASRAPGKTKLDRWLDAVATGLEVSREDPAYQLRERLMRGMSAATREGLLERWALMIKSWNLWSKGEMVTMREFRWQMTGKNAEAFPKVAGAKL